MYLSKIKLTWEQAQNPYEQHRALWRLFPGQEEESRSFLFRIEQLVKGQGALVLMQSHLEPLDSDDVGLVAVREYFPKLHSGQRLRFRLRANPVKTVKDERKGTIEKNGKVYTRTARVPLIDEGQQQAWIERKLSEMAHLESLLLQQEKPLNFRKGREKRSGKIQPVLFDGLLTVQEPEPFLMLMQEGIGPAKAFGCGLLSLAPG